MPLSRRQLLHRGAAGAGFVAVGDLAGLLSIAVPTAGATPPRSILPAGPYGALVPDPDGLLDLPEGFAYTVVSEAGKPTADGGVIPDRFDGTGLFTNDVGNSILVRNSEQAELAGLEFPATAAPEYTYDPQAGGGTTTVEVDATGGVVDEYVSLAGTVRNCAGGVTPWGTWLTGEETEDAAGEFLVRDHGFVFEVDPIDVHNNVNPTPLEALGRFSHEAVAVDPRDGMVYLTEDAGEPFGLLYRATPSTPLGGYGSLRDGALLEALVATDESEAIVPDLAVYTEVGTTLTLGWAEVPDPLAAETPTRFQFDAVTRSQKLEGAWWGNDAAYVVASFAREGDGAPAGHDGQVWRLDPVAGTLELVVRFPVNAHPDGDIFDGPDNITVAPWGGLILCADGEGVQHLYAVGADGSGHVFARNARDTTEFAGAVFSADGTTLFVSMYSPGVTFAVTGPWDAAAVRGSSVPRTSAPATGTR